MAKSATVSVSMSQPDIGVLTLDMPGKSVNLLSSAVLTELDGHLSDLVRREDLAGLIIVSGKTGSFIVGADLRELTASLDAPREEIVRMCQRGQTILARLAQCPFVTVAAIHGVCLGGGAELAAWCDRRIVSSHPRTEFGFPEVNLGILPGWGGTARAPRMVGLGNAVEMITRGKSIDARTAVAMAWASDIVPVEQLVQAAEDLIRAEQSSGQYLRDRQQWCGPTTVSQTELEFLGVTASARVEQQAKRQNPAPQAALDVLLGAVNVDLEQACQMEAKAVSRQLGTPINRALINVFLLTDRNKKDTGIDNRDFAPRKVSSIGVVGAGIMGAGIAAANVKRQLPVVMTDACPDALQRGARDVIEEVAYDHADEKGNVECAIQLASFLSTVSSYAELADCDIVIEAVVEDAAVKRQLFARLEPDLKPDAILASNTSTIPVSGLAEGLKRPEQFCGLHFFNPVRRMQLVEVIRGRQTSDQTLATAVAYCKRIGKSPIVANDKPGFVVNRMLSPYLNASLELVIEGARIEDVDRAATRFGMNMGPIALYDMVGLDTAMQAGRVMLEAYPHRINPTPIIPTLVKAGRLGQKTGLGFYSYQNKKRRPQSDPGFARLIEPFVREPGRKYSDQELTARLFMPMLLEATCLLEDRIVRDVRDADLGLILGVGFPASKGGLFFWADTLGAAKIIEMLKPLEHLGSRGEPTALLKEMATTGRRFYG